MSLAAFIGVMTLLLLLAATVAKGASMYARHGERLARLEAKLERIEKTLNGRS